MDRRPGTRFIPLATIPFLFHGARPSSRSPLGFELDADARAECDQCPPGLGIERYLRVREFLPGAFHGYRELPREGAFSVYVRRDR
jgi:hypothetical protein